MAKKVSSKNSGHTAKYSGPAKFVINCPSCPNNPVSDPSQSAIKTNSNAQLVTCKAGHRFFTHRGLSRDNFKERIQRYA